MSGGRQVNPSRRVSMATSHDADASNAKGFMQQVTHVAMPTWTGLFMDHGHHRAVRDDDAMQLIGQEPTVRANGTNTLPMDQQWMACCGDGTVLSAIDSSFRTLVNTNEQHTRRRTASLVSIAKTGTALPLSFEVSRRVRAQSVPEPTGISVLGLAGLLLLRRPRGRHQHA